MPRPPFGSPEWLPYFLEIVRTSKTRWEAVRRLGYANPSIIDYHLKKFGIERPSHWRLKPSVSRQRRGRVPDVILPLAPGRAWVACLMQGEGLIGTHYSKKADATALELRVGMTDSAPVFRFCDLVGIGRPKKPSPRASPQKPVWFGAAGGLRAYRVLQEVLPFLLGQKLDEASRALMYFAPDGYRNGRHGGYDVWPASEFPLRRRGYGMYMMSLRGKFADSTEDFSLLDKEGTFTRPLDRCCIRIGDTLLNASSGGSTLVEIMDETGLAWRTVIQHLKHLEENSLMTREKIYQRLGGPRHLCKPNQRLVELRDRGWVFDVPDQPSEE
jgi:hypothetical protein